MRRISVILAVLLFSQIPQVQAVVAGSVPVDPYADLVPGSNSADAMADGALPTTLEHVSRNGAQGGNEASFYATISADGRFVAFAGNSTNLIPNQIADMNVKDLLTGAIVNEATSATGIAGNSGQFTPVISADGLWVVFKGNSSNLIPPASPANGMIYAASLTTNAIEPVSTTSGGSFADRSCNDPDVSADGRYVVFSSAATNLAAAGNASFSDIFLKDRLTGNVKRLSTGLAGGDGNGESAYPKISADGRFVVFESAANNLTPGDTNGYTDVFLWDRADDSLSNITGGPAVSNPNNASLRPDVGFTEGVGGAVVFQTGKGLVAEDTCNSIAVYAYDLTDGTFTLVSSRADGSCVSQGSTDAAVSGNGRYVVFTGYSDTLVPGDANGAADVFVKDLRSGEIALVSKSADGTPGNQASGRAQLSLGGEWIVFESGATTLAATDANGNFLDVFALRNPLIKSGVISFGAAAYRVGENAGPAKLTVRRTGGTDGEVSVRYQVADGTATSDDYDAGAAGTITWAEGDNTPTVISVPVTNDAYDEPDETFTVLLGDVTGGAKLGTPSAATVTIVDDDPTPTVQFTQKSSSGAEAIAAATFDVLLSAPLNVPLAVDFTTVDGTAKTADADYLKNAGQVVFASGQTHQSISVTVLPDNKVEGNETFAVKLSKPLSGNALLGANATHTYTIINDDPAGAIQLSAAVYLVHEQDGSVKVTARRLGSAKGTVEVKCATVKGTALEVVDYGKLAATLRWTDGDATDKFCEVPVFADGVDEPDETFVVKLTAPTGGATLGWPSSATVTILDDNPTPTVRFNAEKTGSAESTTSAEFVVVLSGPSSRNVSVNYATEDGSALAGSTKDYRAKAGTLTFKPGETRKSITVSIVNDKVVENPGAESFKVKLLPDPVNASLGVPAVHTYTILDEDLNGAVKLSAAKYSIGEGGPKVTITAQRLGGVAGAVSVTISTADGTATASDYTPVGAATLSWKANEKGNRILEIPIANDLYDEYDETFTVWLHDPTGGAVLGSPSAAIVTIKDNDPPPQVFFRLAAASGQESMVNPTLEVVLSRASSKIVEVQYATANGTATAPSDYLAANGTLKFMPGVTSQLLPLAIVNDAAAESGPGQTFTVKLLKPVNATLGARSKLVYTIVDDD